jgi:hypothetical protein
MSTATIVPDNNSRKIKNLPLFLLTIVSCIKTFAYKIVRLERRQGGSELPIKSLEIPPVYKKGKGDGRAQALPSEGG